MKLFSRLSFRQQLLLFLSLGILVMLAITSYVQYLTAEKSLREKQIEQGVKLSQTFASQSVLALLFDTETNSEEAVKSILDFPDVVAAEIYRYDNSMLTYAGDEQFKIDKTIHLTQAAELHFENDRSWYFVAPVIQLAEEDNPFEEVDQGDELIGYVRLAISKESLNENAREHLFSNIAISVALGLVFVLFMMWLSSRLTSPIRNLISSMKQVEQGHREVRAKSAGPSDVQRIIHAFNQMVETREHEEEQIRKAHDMAVEVAQIKGDFAANVSHELRTPMNGIMGMIDIMRSSSGLNQKHLEFLEIMHSSSESLLDMINDILDFSKMDSGKIDFDSSDFYLEDVCQGIIDLLSGQAHRKDVELGLIMDHDLPDLVNGDSNRLRQVLTNLVGNAIKFTEEGEVIIRMELAEETSKHVTFKFLVEDTGIGIGKDVLEKIYQPFQQVDGSASSKYPGTGLGLTISKQLIDLMGGEIGVESMPGKGSIFWFTVPFKHPKNEPKYNVEQHRPDVAGLRVMVIDDSVVNRQAVSSILSNWDAYHQSAPTALAALNKLKQAANKGKAFDFVIMDQAMKSMNCEDLVNHIRSTPDLKHTKIIMTTNANALGKTEALRKGVDGIVQKPIRDIKLYQCMTSIMNLQPALEFNQITQQELLPIQRRILVCEDTATNVIVAQEILNGLGCTVDVAENGQDAIDNFNAKNYDMILMDCRMPIMDGYEATKLFRSRELADTHTPIVAMTANTQKDDKQNCLDAGMDDYLPKPLSIESVKSMLLKWANTNNKPALMEQSLEVDDNTREISALTTQELPIIQQEPASSHLVYSSSMDELQFQRLLSSVGQGAVVRMLDIFISELPNKLAGLSSAADESDRKNIIEIAHSLKGSSANFGSEVFADCAKEIEITAPSAPIEALKSKILELSDEAILFQRELEQLRDQLDIQQVQVEYNVLVVEDNQADLVAMTSCLQNNNLNVNIAKNGTEAIQICKIKLPDLILLDAMMPEKYNPKMDGFLACTKIKEMPGAQNVPILMVTSLDDEMSVNKAIDAGASDYITKPVNYSVLQRRVKQLLVSSNSERQLKKVAYTDPLTGLPNRPYFIDKASKTLKDHHDEGLTSILFLGLDQFKFINDALGHEIGDLVLQSVAKRLKALANENILVARTGGDEFCILLDDIFDLSEVENFAKKIRFEISQPFYIQKETVNVTGSIGISVYPLHGQDLPQLMKRADTATYYAKDDPKGYLFFDPEMGEKATRRLKVLSALQDAIHNNQLVLNYQPQYSVKEQAIVGCEALVRWNSPHHSTIYPDEFIPYAEESGLINELGEWVILTACQQLKIWEDNGFTGMKMAINLSGVQLEQEDLPERVAEILNQTGISSSQIEFEITESSLMRNPDECRRILMELRNMGIEIAIDDFGTGFNTLVHLEQYPINTIKIDKSFVDNIRQNEAPSVIQGIVSFSKGLNYHVVAEGVETPMQRVYLEELGCDYLQGYLLGKPMSAAIFEQSVLRKNKLNAKQMELSVTPISRHIKKR